MDPSVQFGLQFTVDVEATREANSDIPAEAPAVTAKPALVEKPSPIKRAPAAKSPKPQPKKESGTQMATTDAAKPAPPSSGKEASTGEVVRLDRFRKK